MAEIEAAFGTTPELVRGDGGVFDVDVDGTLVFSKHEVHRFPTTGEVVELIRSRA